MSNDLLANVQFKARSGAQVTVDKAEGIVECFVAGIGNKDSVGDIVLPGAFTESLKRRKPRVVWGHSWNDPIGKVLEIYEVPNSDPRLPQKMKSAGIGGLFAKVQFNLGAEKGREAFANVAFFGEEQEWSIGYKTLQANFDPVQQANMLKEVELYEVSPVLHGANQLTGTISVKDGEAAACGTNGCDCSVKSTAIEPEAPEGIVFEKGSMMGRMPMVMIPLPIPSPGGNSVDASNRDIWSRGEAGPIDLEDRRKLATEIHGRTKVPIKIVEATENMVVFLRKMVDGTERMYRMPYHKTDSGQYMFGKPARVKPQTVYAPDNTPNPMGHIHHKPNSGPLLAKDPNGEEFKDGAPMLIPCAVENILETKDALSPILEYYEATVTPSSGGLIITDYKPEFREAANTALKALGGKLGRGGGLGKGRRAGRALAARFDPRAWDGDNDGLVQEGTPFERPSIPGINTNLPGQPHTRQKPKESPDDHRSSPQRGMRSTADERVRPGANARRADQDSAVDMDEILDREDERTPDGLLDPTYRRRLGATPMTPSGMRSRRDSESDSVHHFTKPLAQSQRDTLLDADYDGLLEHFADRVELRAEIWDSDAVAGTILEDEDEGNITASDVLEHIIGTRIETAETAIEEGEAGARNHLRQLKRLREVVGDGMRPQRAGGVRSQRDADQRESGKEFEGVSTEDLQREQEFIRSLRVGGINLAGYTSGQYYAPQVPEDVETMEEIYGSPWGLSNMTARLKLIEEELELRGWDDIFQDEGIRREEIRDMSLRDLRSSDIHPDVYEFVENTFSGWPEDDPIWDMTMGEIAKLDQPSGNLHFADHDIERMIVSEMKYRAGTPGSSSQGGRGFDPGNPDAGRRGGVRSSRGDGIPDDLGDDDDYSDWLARNHEMTDETLDEMARYYDDPPNSGMRSMASGDRRKRIGELNEKLQVLDEEISRAGRFEDPDYKRMVDTENRLTTEISALRRSETLFDLESGSRSRIAAKKTLELNLTEDEIGSLRNHIQEMVKGNTDKKVNGALASYDTLLSSAKNGKIKVPVEVYDNIIDNWDKATGGKKIHPKTGRDILEFAAMSDDSKFTSTSVGRGDNHYSGFGKQRVNNGAPPEITPRMQKEMLGGMRLRRDTGQGAGDTQARLQDMSQIDMNDVLDDERSKSTPGVRGHLSFVGGHGLMANAMREDGHGSPRQWQMVRGHHGMRSSVGDQGPVKPSSLPGAKKKGGRQVGDKMPEKRLQGKKFDEVKPSNWKEMTDEEQWDFISSLRSWSKDRPDGIRQVDLDRVSKELAKKIEIRERREKRREGKFETIAERRARRLEQGVSLPEPKETPSKEPQPQTPQGAARERRETLEAMDNIFARAHSRAQKASDDDELGSEHLDFWGKTMDILSDSDDLTYSQIEALDALFEEYLGVEFENMSAPESASRRTALAQKGNIETLLEKYRGNRDIQQGDSSISERLGGADEIVDQTEVGDAVGVVGMRSMVSRNSALFSPASPVTQYVQARRPTGMRATREGRTQVNGEATFFKKVGDSLPREISEARKDDNRTTVKALELLQQILKRQESGKVGDKRSNAGTLTVTQAEVDQILEGLMDVVDRQVATDGSRTKMFVELLELLSEAAMSTFIMETTEEIHARTQRRRNSRGDQVSIPLNPS
jgi:HK97 family phage prohead protease